MSRISDTGRADNQSISTVVVMSAVEELEAEIDRLQHRLSNQAATIRVMSETIRRMQDSAIATEPPMEEEVANVPCEPVAVHPAPNVTRAGGE